VVLATGGLGHAYPATTNPPGVAGEGLALALLAGASLADVEFVQFHPTVLHTGAPGGQLPLVTEALRGAGARLLDHRDRAFMTGRHPLADLAPRDVVARQVHAEMVAAGRDHVWLDARGVPDVESRFPTVFAAAGGIGVDPRRDLLPVAPAEHFLCGGIVTDRWGATDVPGLYAVGEVADTGVHGANRLASNSLLEGLTFGRRVAARLVLDLPARPPAEVPVRSAAPATATPASGVARETLGRYAGVVRDADGLRDGLARLDRVRSPESGWLVARAVLAAAAERRETRGCHTRSDHPHRLDWWQRRVTVRLDGDGVPTAHVDEVEVPAA
ncbi:FAD-binding protein, partial [Jatrophihabitans endophyticus]|uniref:FAD-binding protein n=1 Tax=Jatrophihabitans endophyticus TaxID=1206085 RepID=UPI0019D8C872